MGVHKDALINKGWEAAGVYPGAGARLFADGDEPEANAVNALFYAADQNVQTLADFLDNSVAGKLFFADDLILAAGSPSGRAPAKVIFDYGFEALEFKNAAPSGGLVHECFFQYFVTTTNGFIDLYWTANSLNNGNLEWGVEIKELTIGQAVTGVGTTIALVAAHSGIAFGLNQSTINLGTTVANKIYRVRLFRNVESVNDAKTYDALLIGARMV